MEKRDAPPPMPSRIEKAYAETPRDFSCPKTGRKYKKEKAPPVPKEIEPPPFIRSKREQKKGMVAVQVILQKTPHSAHDQLHCSACQNYPLSFLEKWETLQKRSVKSFPFRERLIATRELKKLSHEMQQWIYAQVEGNRVKRYQDSQASESLVRKLKLFTHCTLLATTPSLFVYPECSLPKATPQTVSWFGDWWWGAQEQAVEWVRPTTYDGIMQMLEDLESGELERRYPPEQLERVNEYLATLAKEGILPGEFDEEEVLEEDVEDLMYGEDSAFELTRYLANSNEYMIVPAVLNGYSGYNIVQCGKISKSWKKTKKFCKKHKKAIIIGAVVVVAVAAVTVAVVVATSASAASTAAGAAGAAGAAASGSGSSSGSSKSESNGSSSSTSSSSQASSNTAPTFQGAMEDQVISFKEHLASENFFPSSETGQGLSIEETGRVAGTLFAHDSFNHFNNQIPNYPQLSEELRSISSHPDFALPPGASENPVGFGHNEIDWRFSSNCGPMFSDPSREVNVDALSYQMRGEAASFYGYHNQAIDNFSKAIEMNPTDYTLYFQRSASYLNTEQYDRCLADFNHYQTHVEQSPPKEQFNLAEFTRGFAEGLPQGIFKGGKESLLFVGNCVTHPINTAKQLYEACSTLAKYVHTKDWETIGKALSPELHKVITEWDYT